MRVVVVGSGPSGVHAAQTLLESGHQVTMLDVGRERPAPALPDASFDQLKERLDDPVGYFLGEKFQAVMLPGGTGEYYGLPPSKDFVLAPEPAFGVRSDGFAPLSSFARGGLAEAWTAGVYPYNDGELKDFPFGWSDLKPYYEEVARRIGVSGEDDDLAAHMPWHEHVLPPLGLDVHSERLLARYAGVRSAFHATGVRAGRSRLAVLTRAHEGREPCSELGRCLWGCPHQALYTPAVTLRRLQALPSFSYAPDSYVTHFTWDGARRLTGVAVRRPGGAGEVVSAEALVLAAGALSTARIVLESVYRDSGEVLTLPGLMDNQQILVPFVNLDMLGREVEMRRYTYHQVCLGLASDDPRHYLHAQLTTLKQGMAHPVLASLPFDLGTSRHVFRLLRGALGVANANLHDTRRDDCVATLEPGQGGAPGTLLLRYVPAPGDAAAISAAMARVRSALGKLRCLVPPGMAHVRPKGASVHYAGLIPMGGASAPLTATPDGRSNDWPDVWFSDGVTFPFLPAKNITFTLMANAIRMARALG